MIVIGSDQQLSVRLIFIPIPSVLIFARNSWRIRFRLFQSASMRRRDGYDRFNFCR